MNWKDKEIFVKQFTNNFGWLYNQIDDKTNRKLFLDECLVISRNCEQYNNVFHIRIYLESALKTANLEKDGWIFYNKKMKTLAYTTALDVIYSIYKKSGLCALS